MYLFLIQNFINLILNQYPFPNHFMTILHLYELHYKDDLTAILAFYHLYHNNLSHHQTHFFYFYNTYMLKTQ